MSAAKLWKSGLGIGPYWTSPQVTTDEEFQVMDRDRAKVRSYEEGIEVDRMFCLFFSLYFKEQEDEKSVEDRRAA